MILGVHLIFRESFIDFFFCALWLELKKNHNLLGMILAYSSWRHTTCIYAITMPTRCHSNMHAKKALFFRAPVFSFSPYLILNRGIKSSWWAIVWFLYYHTCFKICKSHIAFSDWTFVNKSVRLGTDQDFRACILFLILAHQYPILNHSNKSVVEFANLTIRDKSL